MLVTPSADRWRVKDKFKETGSNKELFDLTNNDRFVSDTRHLMVLAILVMILTAI